MVEPKPTLVGYYRISPGVRRMETALVGQLATWCNREGYLLGTPYRDEGVNGAIESLLDALEREDVAGVVVPSLDHLGPQVEAQVSRIRDTGKHLFVADPTEARR